MDLIPSPSSKLDLTNVIGALRGSLFGWAGRGVLTVVLMQVLHWRLGVIAGDFARLVARFRAGRLWRVRVRVVAAPSGEGGRRVWVRAVWPSAFGWLTGLMQHRAAVYTAQMEIILAEPEMVALLAVSPQAVRLLRPVCRMLGVSPSLLRPGVLPEVVVRVVKPRVRTPRVPVDWGRIPLPRGVLTWARREGFGRVPRETGA